MSDAEILREAARRSREWGRGAGPSGRQQIRRSQGAYSNRYQVLLPLLCLHKVKPLDERERSSLFSDMHTPLNLLAQATIGKGFRPVRARRVRHIDHPMRLREVKSVFRILD